MVYEILKLHILCIVSVYSPDQNY